MNDRDPVCSICGKSWHFLDPGVHHLAIDDAWTCTDEAACFDRRAYSQPEQPVTPAGPDEMRWHP